MDPISAIFVMVVLGGLFAKGVDAATDGLLSAELGGGVRGAAGYVGRDVRGRWRLANAKAREIRGRTPQGRAVQQFIDTAGLFGRVLFGEARRFGSGVRSEWRTGREQARSARTERRGGAPWPIVRAARSGAVRAREWSERHARSGAATPNEPEPNDPDDASGEPERQGKPWAHVRYDGCLHETGSALDEEGLRWPRYCGEPREPGWVLCPTHLAAVRNDPAYPQEDIDEYRTDTDYLGPDAYCGGPDPNGDPNDMPDSTVPDANGDIRCGCCTQRHKPLPPGEHCPNCHTHDAPNARPDQIPNAPTMRGPSMDINSAPAAIAAAEALRSRFEEPESLLASLSNDAISTLEGMGDFGTGDETDTAGRFQPVLDALGSAREAVDVYVAALHEEWDEHIAAAEGRTAGAHAPFQEV